MNEQMRRFLEDPEAKVPRREPREKRALERGRPIKQQSMKQKLREAYLSGVKAGFLFMLVRLDPIGPHCEECGTRGNSVSLDLDHIVPRSKSGHDRPDNLQLLCRPCHQRKHGQPQFSGSGA